MSNYTGTVEEVEKARAKRRKEIQAWALADQAAADALLGVPTDFDNDWDLVPEESTPVVQESEPVSTPVVQEEETVEPPKPAPKTPKPKAATPS